MSVKIGVITTRSVIYPSMALDMLGGLRGYMQVAGIQDYSLTVESAGVGADDKLIYEKCEKMLLEGASVVAGYVNPTTAEKLNPLFAAANTIFIALDAGYNFAASAEKLSHVFTVSLQGALCSRIATKTAIEDGVKKMAYTASFYDAGYRTAFAVHNCMAEQGASVSLNHITKLKRADFSLEPVVDNLKKGDTDGLFISFCGDMLLDFCTAARSEPAFESQRIYGSPFAGEELWLEKCLYPGADIKTFVTWAKGLDNTANKIFITQLESQKQNVCVFSVLGWEAGQLAAHIMKATGTAAAIQALEGYEYKSPRGSIYIDPGTHECQAPVYEATVVKNEATGNCVLIAGPVSKNLHEQRLQHTSDIKNISGQFTSWYNAYACLES